MPEPPAPKKSQTKPKRPANKKKSAGAVSVAITTIAKPVIVLKPKAAAIAKQKELFLAELAANGGLINKALAAAKFSKKTAYAHFNTDPVFRDAWLVAGELAHEELTSKILTRAEQSDTLLIYAHRQGENKNKWRRKMGELAQQSVNAVREAGAPLGMTEDQIQGVERAIIEKFKYISLQ